MNRPTEIARSLFPAEEHGRILLVGGVVRDAVIGAEGEDLDLIAALPAESLLRAGFRFVESKSSVPVYFRHDDVAGKVEVTNVASLDDVPGELRRRDFTANAMAMDLFGVLVDPLGGKGDAEARMLRACSPAAFLDDPIRVFRAFRFEAAGWRMMPGTESLLRESLATVPDVFEGVPAERFSREMLKALDAPDPARFFLRMAEFGAGAFYLPELFRMPGVPAGSPVHHPEGDVLSHSVQVLRRLAALSADPLARFCAFFHDIGKLSTDPSLFPRHHGHEDAGFAAAALLCDRLRLPATYRRALSWASRLHGNGHRWGELRDATRITIALQASAAGIAEILPMVCDADRGGRDAMPGWDIALRVAGMTTEALGIDPERLESMKPADRGPFILQARVETLRRIQGKQPTTEGT
jgi:tRNA nucleotidyltransferase (CCA-adding enzyme)